MLAHSYSFDPSSGIQAQLPVLLCEFILTDKQDYDQYFSLLKSIPAYFNSLTALEKAKQKKGTLPSATTIRHTIRQCQEFVDSSGTDAIEKSFEKSINSASFFSASGRKESASSITSFNRVVVSMGLPCFFSFITFLAICSADGSSEFSTSIPFNSSKI